MKKRIKCIRVDRPELGPNITDSFLRLNKFYDVINERVPGPINSDDWIEVYCPETRESFQRPRYMFGPVLS